MAIVNLGDDLMTSMATFALNTGAAAKKSEIAAANKYTEADAAAYRKSQAISPGLILASFATSPIGIGLAGLTLYFVLRKKRR